MCWMGGGLGGTKGRGRFCERASSLRSREAGERGRNKGGLGIDKIDTFPGILNIVDLTVKLFDMTMSTNSPPPLIDLGPLKRLTPSGYSLTTLPTSRPINLQRACPRRGDTPRSLLAGSTRRRWDPAASPRRCSS